jgi:Protein of unknown function (DUF732)
MAVRLLALCVVPIAAFEVCSASAHADMVADSFLAALSSAGIEYGDPTSAVALGQSICPMVVQPDGTFATVASRVASNTGMSVDKAGVFTVIAISRYCPAVISLVLPDRRQI